MCDPSRTRPTGLFSSPPVSPQPWSCQPPPKDTQTGRGTHGALPLPGHSAPRATGQPGQPPEKRQRPAGMCLQVLARQGGLSAHDSGLREAPEPARPAHLFQGPRLGSLGHDAKYASSEVPRISSWFQDSPLTLRQQMKFTICPSADMSSHLPLSRRLNVGGGTTRCPLIPHWTCPGGRQPCVT